MASYWREKQTYEILQSVKGRPILTLLWKLWFWSFDWVFTPLFVGLIVLMIFGSIWSVFYVASCAWHAGGN